MSHPRRVGAMIEVRATGDLTADPVERQTRAGRPCWTATLRVPAGPDSLLIGLTVFSETAGAWLAPLRKGAKIACAGTLEPAAWTGRDGQERTGWRLTATEVLSVHRARKRREAERRDDQAAGTRQAGQPLPEGGWLDA